ncbi:PREDICTED: uncharacterized protein LOC109159883 [Ipomoea nil]|uniref:uncharacterized protein LOC109159883 n=1 Tax=Ipomoea nil TaxID=35883 RepID=UPI000900DE8B|nr:PREDICTED: uncharacterized protein LOC109159883 [Ipomoea nil]
MSSSAPNSGMDRMDGFAKAFGAVSGVASTAWGYAKQLPSSDINGKSLGAVSGVASTAWDYAKQLPISDINGKAFGAVSGVASAACGYAKELSNSATVQQKLNILRVQSSQIADLQSIKGMCTGLGVNVKTVGAVATVGIAAWGAYMLHGGSGKKMMKNPGRPWERIDANKFRYNPIDRKAIFDRTHTLKVYLISFGFLFRPRHFIGLVLLYVYILHLWVCGYICICVVWEFDANYSVGWSSKIHNLYTELFTI